METKRRLVQLTIRVSVERKVRVRAYKRTKNGRIEKIHSHYRRMRVI